MSSPLKPLGWLKPNFIWSLLWKGEWKFVKMVQVTWPRWPPCPYGKTLKKSSFLEPKSRWPWNLVYCIGCSSTTKLDQMMTLGWPWPILQQGQIWSLMLLYGTKVKQNRFFRNYCFLWCQSWYMQLTKWLHELIWISKVRVINWPWSKVTRVQHFFFFFFFRNH